ncbi:MULTISPECIES: hypothetical protein [Janthinobacterium]|uniref:Uncharacterized protein n=1 Tax=Janthinobacterium violaceinigrum TaxID=2654252 RepID=A0A6I1HW25_9BURK|nr:MULTISPECIES: hypothetical protein [Janthinobacterium]KAB8057448.1 hypothetical protein GCN74_20225 [Janthinobacterium sp. FT14W]KAB8062893.1 hypothetical protein GCN75_21105 [Janthinobacterium violaceinigrum]
MSTFTNTYSNNDNYFSNLGRATRAFLGALLASKPYSELAQKEVIAAGTASADAERHVRPSQRDFALLNSEANRYEKLMPNLAAELRFLASRG